LNFIVHRAGTHRARLADHRLAHTDGQELKASRYGIRMAQWWELTIPAAAGVAGAILGALVQGLNARRLYAAEAEERRKARFVEERRTAYVRYLAAFAEWEPLRAEAWRLRDEMDQSGEAVDGSSR
jgi:hypothetical protein